MSKKALVYFVGMIGDTVNALPAMLAIREFCVPSTALHLLYERHRHLATTAADLVGPLELFGGYHEYIVDSGMRGLLGKLRLLRDLRAAKYDEVFYLVPSLRKARQVLRDRWFFRLAGIRRMNGFRTLPDVDSMDSIENHEAVRLLRRLQLGAPGNGSTHLQPPFLIVPEPIQTRVDGWLSRERRHPRRRLVTICPGTKQPANQWDIVRFAEMGRRILDTMEWEICLVGGIGEAEVCRQLLQTWADGISAAGVFTVLESAALLRRAQLNIGLDTGTTHLAAATGTRCIGIYGGREPVGRWHPLGNQHVVLRVPVPCLGCRLVRCPVEGHPCMSAISVDDVWQAFERTAAEMQAEKL